MNNALLYIYLVYVIIYYSVDCYFAVIRMSMNAIGEKDFFALVFHELFSSIRYGLKPHLTYK